MASILSQTVASKNIMSTFERSPEEGRALVHDFCDLLLDPSKDHANGPDVVDWIKVLFSEGDTFENFSKKVNNMDSSSLCGCVWTADFVAYRCRTCATSPCMSLCAACFEKGNHTGHDYNIFRSEAGGACDCGDSSVLQISGFCSHHGPNRIPPEPQPLKFLGAGKVLLDRIFLMFIHILRSYYAEVLLQQNTLVEFPAYVKSFLELILELVKLGSPVRSHVSQLLLDETLYSDIMQCKAYKCLANSDSPIHVFHKKSIDWFLAAVESGNKPMPVPEIKDTGQFVRSFQYKNYLDEITFWIVKFEFPESVILIILNLLPDTNMKWEFSKTFSRHYTRIATSLLSSPNVDQLSNRVVHISVQLFSNDELAYMLATEEHLLQIFLVSLYNIMYPHLQQSHTTNDDYHQCLSSKSTHLKTNVYWPVVSDFVNVLSHQRVVRMFLGDPDLMSCWFQLLMYFNGMDLCRRALDVHIEYEYNHTLHAFYVERESCAALLWCMLDVLEDASTVHITLSVIRILLDTINEFFDALGFDETRSLPYNQCSFHYPLHRYLAHFMSNAIKHQGLNIDDMPISEETAIKLMAHPLQVLTTMHEVQANLWVRNGVTVSTQALAYKQFFFCKFFIDADLYLLQFCACKLSPDYFVAKVFERYRVISCLNNAGLQFITSEPYESEGGTPKDEKLAKMFEGAFKLILTVFGVKTTMALNDEEMIRGECIVLLTTQPCTYSNLSDPIPHESNSGPKMNLQTDFLANILETYATKKEGDAMEQTTYLPNSAAWELYDPLFNDHRTLYRRDLHQAHSNYLKLLKTRREADDITPDSDIWPPYQPVHSVPEKYAQMGKILHCRTFFAFVFVALHKRAEITDNMLSIVLHLLGAAVRHPPQTKMSIDMVDSKRCKKDGDQWYSPFQALYLDDAHPCENIMKMLTVYCSASMDDLSQVQSNDTLSPTPTPSAQQAMQTNQLFAKESILTLLLKLYDESEGRPGSFLLDPSKYQKYEAQIPVVPPTRSNVILNLLHVAASKNKEFEQTIQVICKSLSPHPNAMPQEDTCTGTEKRARRRMQAMEAQKRLMKQISVKQQEFMKSAQMQVRAEQTNAVTAPLRSATQVAAASNSVVPSGISGGRDSLPLYECVICGMSETEFEATHNEMFSDVEKKLMGIICLAQPSSVLGHRSDCPRRTTLRKPGCTKVNSSSCNPCVLHQLQWLRSFNIASNYERQFREQNLYATCIGTHISSCGHYVHLSCHRAYMEAVKQDEMNQLALNMLRGFQCPVCRQISNLVLPCNIKPQHYNILRVTDHRGTLSKIWMETLSDINAINSSATCGAVIAGQKINTSLHIVAYAASLLRSNLEFNLLQLGNKLIFDLLEGTAATTARKLPVDALFVLLYRMNSLHGSRETKEQNSAKAQRILDELSGKASNEAYDVPLLLEDPVALLIRLLLERPLRSTEFKSTVQLVYNLAFIQALVHVSCKFSEEERRAWKNKVSPKLGGIAFSDNVEFLLAVVIRNLPSKLFELPDECPHMTRFQKMGCTTTVFSPQSVVTKVEKKTIRFLQIACLLYQQLFKLEQFPMESNSKNEFGVLASYLGLGLASYDTSNALQCLKMDRTVCVISRWCNESCCFIKSNAATARQMFTAHRSWLPPRLIDLPYEYSSFFQLCRQMKCDKCGVVPREPTLCLVCGAYVCYKNMCEADGANNDPMLAIPENSHSLNSMHAGCRHAQRCGAGTCILLLVNSSVVVIIRGTRACMWGTPYLDVHGEEDRGWKRGKPLFLKKERLELLEKQWINHSFDNTCQSWTAHRNSL